MKKYFVLPLFLLFAAGVASAQQETVVTGKLLGSDGKAVPNAHVHLFNPAKRKMLSSVEAAKDGSYKLAASETGLFQLQFTGVNHYMETTPLLIEKAGSIEIDVRLKPYDYSDDFNKVKIIGDFNEYNFETGKPMQKQADGTFVAEFETSKDEFSYQLIGIDGANHSINGTQSEKYVYDGGGDYQSIVTPKNGKVKIVFDPKLLSRSKGEAQTVFADPKSIVAKCAELYSKIPPFSPLWTLKPSFIAETAANAKEPMGVEEYTKLVLDKYPDPEMKAYFLYNELMQAKFTKNQDKVRQNYDRLVGELGDTKWGKLTKERISRDPKVWVGGTVPAFSLASLDDPKNMNNNESLKGKIYMIDFWATWCGPCVGEMDHLHQAYEKFKDKNFEIISLSFDQTPDHVRKFRNDKWKMPWRHSFVENGFQSDAARSFEVLGIPKPILVDGSGKVLAMEEELRGEQLEKTLARILNGTK